MRICRTRSDLLSHAATRSDLIHLTDPSRQYIPRLAGLSKLKPDVIGFAAPSGGFIRVSVVLGHLIPFCCLRWSARVLAIHHELSTGET